MSKSTEQVQRGLVTAWFGHSVAVEADDGQVIPCQLHRNQTLPVVGDRVSWQWETEDSGIVLDIEPRRSLLLRADIHGHTKPLAANIDVIIVVMAPPPILSENLIDRYLIAAEGLNITPVIVINKADLLTDASRAEMMVSLQAYQQIPYDVILSSVFQPDGLSALSACLTNKTAVLVGPSGVGKSSIIAALSKSDSIRIGEVSPKGIGKHTTTGTRLYHLPHGTMLIDSPGVREFHLGTVRQQDLLKGFREFRPYLQGCKFRDCIHVAEPGCLVQEAVESGKISAKRYAHYQELMKTTKLK